MPVLPPTSDRQNGPRNRWSLWTSADQRVLALILVVSFVGLIGSHLIAKYRNGGQIDFDQAERATIEFKVDINQADWPELMLLPGVGETYARRIVGSRETIGPFVTFEELQRVPGIGPKTLDKMRPYLLPIQEQQQSGMSVSTD